MIKKYYNIIYLLISIILFITASNVNAKDEVYDSYKIGDVITYSDMKFYVIANSDSNQDYVTLLKKTPLTDDEVNKYGVGHVNMHITSDTSSSYYQQAYWIHGYGGMAYYSSLTCGYNGLSSGCTNDYAKSEIKYVVDAWAADKFKSSDLSVDATGYSARLITYDELLTLGYNANKTSAGPGTDLLVTDDVPSWVYNSDYSYWTMSPYNDSTFYVWDVYGTLRDIDITSYNSVVRPVISLKKQVRSSSLNDYDYNKKTYKQGEIVYYKGNQYYVLRDALEDDSTVTLLKATPLTTGQVKEYGQNHVNMYMPEWDQKILGYYKRPYDSQGYGSIAYYSDEKCGFVSMPPNGYEEILSGCTAEYDKSDVKYVLDNWAKDFLDDNDLSKDKFGYKYRLITLDELNELGYSVDAEGKYSYNDNIPRWIYGNYKYFTMTPSDDGNHSMIVVDKDGKLNVSTYNMVTTLAQEYFGTIRPVITLTKATKNEVVNVPDTLLSMPVLGVIIGTLILIISIIIIYLVLKNRKKQLKI